MSPRPKVVVTDFLTEPLDCERRILGDVAEVKALNARSEEELVGRVEDADCIILFHLLRITRRTIERLQKCRLIVRAGVGFDNVDVEAARERGIPVANVPDYGTEEVADSALGMALTLTRGIHQLNGRLQGGNGPWSHVPAAPLRRLRGRTFGVIGLGRIGTAAALRAKAFGMDVLFHDPFVPQGRDKSLGVRRAETLEELLRQSWIVSVHCPLTPATRHLLNRETLKQMPPGAYVVNTARGAVVDTVAVLEAVTSGRLAGAGLDVLETEPPAADHPLIAAWRDPGNPLRDRIIINPHAAFYSEEGAVEMREKAAKNCRRVLQGELPWNVVS